MMKKAMDMFNQAQKSIISEIDEARHEILAGRYERAYTILTNLSNELETDVAIYEQKESKFEKLIKLAVKEYAENEYKKELSQGDQTEDSSK